MKRSLLAVSLLLLAALPGAAQTKTRYLIGTKTTVHAVAGRLTQSNDDVLAHRVRAFDNLDTFAATLTSDEAAALRRSAGVRYVTPVVERHLLDAPAVARTTAAIVASGSPYSSAQTVPYGVDLLPARGLWPVARSNRTVHVAVVD